MMMNDTWGFKRNDNSWKSATIIVRNLCATGSVTCFRPVAL